MVVKVHVPATARLPVFFSRSKRCETSYQSWSWLKKTRPYILLQGWQAQQKEHGPFPGRRLAGAKAKQRFGDFGGCVVGQTGLAC